VLVNKNLYFFNLMIFNIKKTIFSFYNNRYISQQKLRHYLVEKRQNKCILCNYIYPYKVLEVVHLKPRSVLNETENADCNNVEFMCRNCHKYYDLGLISVFNGLIIKSKELHNYSYNISNKYIDNYNFNNALYFNYHFYTIFIKKETKNKK
tara:strand:- start:238 stop:690 length:453 start_codon:yes stop_codon:yes gene_type:complete